MRLTINLARHRLVAVVLAAGGSSRLGRPKQLLRRRSTPLVVRSVRLASDLVGGDRVIVVLGHERQRLRSLLRRQARAAVIAGNPGWAEGLASSLRAGLRAVPPTASAVLYLTVDQVRVDASGLSKLVDGWLRRPARPAASHYLGRDGVPAIFPRRWFRRIASLSGDVGARQLLRDTDEITRIDMPTAQFDIDTADDAAGLGY